MVDVAASLYAFLRNHDAGFARMWGSCLPQAGKKEQPEDMQQFGHMLLHDAGDGTPLFDKLVLNQIVGFWPLESTQRIVYPL